MCFMVDVLLQWLQYYFLRIVIKDYVNSLREINSKLQWFLWPKPYHPEAGSRPIITYLCFFYFFLSFYAKVPWKHPLCCPYSRYKSVYYFIRRYFSEKYDKHTNCCHSNEKKKEMKWNEIKWQLVFCYMQTTWWSARLAFLNARKWELQVLWWARQCASIVQTILFNTLQLPDFR